MSWPDWLGYGEGKPPAGTFLVFEDARGHVRDQRFSSRVEVRVRFAFSSLGFGLQGFLSGWGFGLVAVPEFTSTRGGVVAVGGVAPPAGGCAITPGPHVRARGLGLLGRLVGALA